MSPFLRRLWALRGLWALLLIAAGVAWVVRPLRAAGALPDPPWPDVEPAPPDRQQTLLFAPTTLVPDASGPDGAARVALAPRVVVYDPGSAQPLTGVPVRLTLALRGDPSVTARVETTTGDLGAAAPTLSLPVADLALLAGDHPAALTLTVDVSGPVGEQRLEHTIAVQPKVQIDLLTDRRHYQPGQTIHLLARAQSALPLPENALLLAVADAQGTLLCREQVTLSTSGLAAADCPLGERARPGAYRVSAHCCDAAATTAARAPQWSDTVEVSVAPSPATGEAPQVTFRADAPFYAPGETAQVTLHAALPWGAPLPEAPLTVTLSLDGAPSQEPARIKGVTDARGDYVFALDSGLLPGGTLPIEPGLLLLDAEVRGPDGTGYARHALPAAAQPLLIDLTAESETLVPGVENRLTARVRYPDGRPAALDGSTGALTVESPGLDAPLVLETDDQGRAAWTYLPPTQEAVPWTLVARDAAGREARTTVELPIDAAPARLLLRPERDVYAPGEILHLDAWYVDDSPQKSQPELATLYVDWMQDEQPVGGGAAPLQNVLTGHAGHAALDLPLPADLPFGPLELIAYVLPAGAAAPVVDTRQVNLLPPGATKDALNVRLDPESAAYAPGEQAQLAVHVQDAASTGQPAALSVALVSAEADPALPPRPPNRQAERRALTTVRSDTLSVPHPLPPGTESRFEAVGETRQARRDALSRPAQRIVWATLALAALAWIVVIAGAWGRENGPSVHRGWFGRLLGGLLLLALAAGAALLLAYGGTQLLGPGFAILLYLLWLGALLAFGIQVVQRRSHGGQLLWSITGAILALALGLGYARQQGAPLDRAWVLAAWGASLALALALYLYGQRAARQAAPPAAAAAWATAFVLLLTLASVILAPVSKSAQETAQEALAARLALYRPADAGNDGAAPAPSGANVVDLPSAPSRQASVAFPQLAALETAHWLPLARTNVYGERTIEVPLPELEGQARSAWRLAVQAWGQDGATGQAQALLSVSRPLWANAPLPAALTVGDELDLPLSVYHALPYTQTIQVTAVEPSWYAVRGSGTLSLAVPGSAAGQAVLPLTAREAGMQRLEIAAQNTQGRDTFSTEVEVAPNGGRVWRVYDGRLPPVEPSSITATLPADRWLFRVPWLALRGSDQLTITVYADTQTLLAESLAALPLPERPVSLGELAAATRILLQRSWTLTPREGSLLYQRILSYEGTGGGFGSWPGETPDLYSCAEALACLADLSGVTFVDPALLDRTAAWLLARQTEQGTWSAGVPPSWQRLPRLELPVTAHVTARLIEAGYGGSDEVGRAAKHLALYLDKAEDPYVLALVSQALVAYDAASSPQDAGLAPPALDQLAELAQPEGDGDERQAAWRGEIETWSGATGEAADVECTALAIEALLRSETQPDLAAQALAWLGKQRDGRGRWGTAQTHWLAVRAWQAAAQETPDVLPQAQVYVSVGDVAAPPQTLDASAGQTSASLAFEALAKGYNEITLSRDGVGEVRYRIVGTYLLPWDQLPASSPDEAVPFELAYDRTSVAVGEWIAATVTVTPTRQNTASSVVLELGLPPGLEVDDGPWQALVEAGTVERYRQDGRTMIAQLDALPPEEPLQFSYRLQARYPLAVWTPPSRAYLAGDPLRAAVRAPVRIEIEEPR